MAQRSRKLVERAGARGAGGPLTGFPSGLGRFKRRFRPSRQARALRQCWDGSRDSPLGDVQHKIGAISAGQTFVVAGVVEGVECHAAESGPALYVKLEDKSGCVALVWLGREQILGISPGQVMVVRGHVAKVDGQFTMFNPAYELVKG